MISEPPPPLRMAGIAVPGAEEDALGMDVEFSVPDFDGDVFDLAGEADTGVVEQDVQAAVGCHHRVDDLGPVLFRCYVEVER